MSDFAIIENGSICHNQGPGIPNECEPESQCANPDESGLGHCFFG